MRRHALTLVVLLAAGGIAAAAPGKKTATGEPAPTAATGRPLPAAARELLRAKMRNHSVDANLLLRSVLLLDRAEAARLADGIAAETSLARPLAGDGDQLNSLVPARFFDLQDRSRQETRALAGAARSGDDAQLGRAFARVVESCVACHAEFLEAGGAKGL